jgi:serpin B
MLESSTKKMAACASASSQAAAASRCFAFKLLREIVTKAENQNIFISPISISMALAMVCNGATSETEKAICEALELHGMAPADVNAAQMILRKALETLPPEVELTIANSLWGRKEVTFCPDFLQQTARFYSAEIETLDFSSTHAVPAINGWVKNKTKGKISSIIDSISPLDFLILLNAIYFKGNWMDPFDPELTREEPFHLANGTERKHPLMRQTGRYHYLETDRFQAVSLAYGEGNRVWLDLFLPTKQSSLAEFLKSLNGVEWEQWQGMLKRRPGEIILPRFKLSFEKHLNEVLQALGMGIAFDPARAEFERICPPLPQGRTFIGDVIHKTFAEMNEEGTEAAAVTAVLMRAAGPPDIPRDPPKPFRLLVDRPFFFVIRDTSTRTILFMGAVFDPAG